MVRSCFHVFWVVTPRALWLLLQKNINTSYSYITHQVVEPRSELPGEFYDHRGAEQSERPFYYKLLWDVKSLGVAPWGALNRMQVQTTKFKSTRLKWIKGPTVIGVPMTIRPNQKFQILKKGASVLPFCSPLSEDALQLHYRPLPITSDAATVERGRSSCTWLCNDSLTCRYAVNVQQPAEVIVSHVSGQSRIWTADRKMSMVLRSWFYK